MDEEEIWHTDDAKEIVLRGALSVVLTSFVIAVTLWRIVRG